MKQPVQRIVLLVIAIAALGMMATMFASLRRVPVDELLASRNGYIKLRVFEAHNAPVVELQVARENSIAQEVCRAIRDADPQWRWSGRKPDLKFQTFRTELATSECIMRIDSSGMMHIIYANGHERHASVSRAKGLYDRITSIIKTAELATKTDKR